jgi:hypothetical protein
MSSGQRIKQGIQSQMLLRFTNGEYERVAIMVVCCRCMIDIVNVTEM